MHAYEVRPRKDKRGADLISDRLPFGRLWYGGPNAISNAIDNAKFYSGITGCRDVVRRTAAARGFSFLDSLAN
jgi:hypothetical protein